ncbi:gliding motility-associated protein GldE [Ichthyenterobacterium sp. W332]|uniref:Gliding motility-associated protein GldE n=1 Tax=Microcosmobacter mediterraneus TaxID=3075607 RepID=A0ABU2YJ12_9FLAO|nr:gliding motility-associated protein GldE [Ichthyenterobacterium sp. W332]MDT0557792.1 gliding motility-associated protein GldE [Ichthyenterobacterium sp. W332]
MDPEPSFIITLIYSNTSLILGIVAIIILLFCSALISGAEVALFSLSQSDIDSGFEDNLKTKTTISNLLERPKKLLATILVTNNFINIAIVILFASISDDLFENLNYSINLFFFNISLVFFIKVVLATFLILLFGEIIPKIYASRNKISFSSFMSKPLNILDTVFSPVSLPMRYITVAIENRLGKQKSNISVDKLSQALELTSSDETTDEEQKILEGIVSFGNTDTKQVMRPRLDIFALNTYQEFSEIIPEIIKNGYSRIPVYKDNMDTIIGILYSKDLLPHINKTSLDWTSLVRTPFFVPENKKLDDLMVEFQAKKVHLAVVVDEYGGTSGIISLEDIIEEIVGDISDEFDDDDVIYTKLDDKNYSFEGKTTLKDLYKIIPIEDNTIFEERKGEAETIAGFVLEISGSFPRVGSKINFKNYVFTIEGLEKKRIKQIKLTILD